MVLCTLWDMAPESTMGAFGKSKAVLLSVTHPTLGEPADAQFIGSLFDLTPAEARVAGLVAAGLELCEVAQQQSVSIHTVRAQLRSVMDKTGTHRQAEVVHLVLRATSS